LIRTTISSGLSSTGAIGLGLSTGLLFTKGATFAFGFKTISGSLAAIYNLIFSLFFFSSSMALILRTSSSYAYYFAI
jgi:hypothetical protein